MKGNEKVIALLNIQLADELTAVNQYMVHAGMCANWGYEKLHNANEKRAIDEMRHAESLIDRILFLEGIPVVSALNKINIGANVEKQIANDIAAEVGAIKTYNDGIQVCVNEVDNGTRELLESTLKDEERHLDWLESQRDQIGHMGIQAYLSEQLS
ncbi:MAG TPA: bacterioferritin [Leptolinea sp.]